MLNELLFNDPKKVKKAVYDAKNLFSENVPYTIEYRLGNKKTYIFNDHFIKGIIKAFTTDCLDDLNNSEREVLENFINYENSLSYRDITSEQLEVVNALDKWLYNLCVGRENPKQNGCSI